MATEITFRRGSNDPTSGSGITLAEPVFNTNLHTFHIGLGYGITAEWVGAPISGLSADIAAGITYKIPTLAAVKNYVTGTSITNYVSSFNGLTGAVTGVTVGGTNVFTELNSFNAGICASGITLSSGIINAPSVGLYLTSSNTKNAKVNLLSGPSSSQIELDAITVRVRNTTDGALPTLELYEASDVYSAKIQYASSATNDATITFPAFTGTVALTNHVVTSFNGLTGSVTGVTVGGANTFTALNTFNAGISTSTITVSGGSTFTGNISAPNIVNSVVAGTGISVSGTTGSVTITNTGVQSFNGRTGAVTGASLGANTFTGLQTMTSGISAAGGMTLAGTLNTTGDIKFNGTAGKTIRTTQAPLSISGITSGVALGSSNAVVFGVQTTDPLKLYSATGVVEINQDNLINPFTTSIKLFTLDGSETNASVNIAPITYFSADRTLNIQDASGTIALTSQLMGAINGSTAATTAVTSFNGRTGAVQGVSAASAGDGIAVSGATGAVTITNTGVTRAVAGTGISVSGATGSVTITNIGVQSFNGNTGAVTGASLGANTFTALNTFNAGISASGGITFGSNISAPNIVNSFNGLTGAVTGVTVGGANTFTALNTFNAGISASGVTLSGSIGFQNAEYIRNTTNGRMDFMPAPAGSTHFGMYMDFTSWSYGVKLGTIRSSDSALNAGAFLWESRLSINSDVGFNLGSDGQYSLIRTTTGNDTGQLSVNCTSGTNSGAWAIVAADGREAANRSPTTVHTNPNLYIYRSGSASANDFIRMEHDGTNANIVSGGTSGILVQPGNGIVGVSGGVSADAFMLAGGGIRTLTGTTYTFLATDNGKVITMNNASGITATVPSGLPVGYSVTVIQLGAGQVGFTAASGVTLNSYTSLIKIAGQHGSASIVSYSSNVFNLAGNLA